MAPVWVLRLPLGVPQRSTVHVLAGCSHRAAPYPECRCSCVRLCKDGDSSTLAPHNARTSSVQTCVFDKCVLGAQAHSGVVACPPPAIEPLLPHALALLRCLHASVL